jgi:hypothetical protein
LISGTAQFGRQYNLTVTNAGWGLDLSQLHFKFKVYSMDLETPNHATIRVYNLSPDTVARIKGGEFTYVVLSAGYQNNVNYGVIFQGDIKRVYTGRESNVDNFVEILAADGDLAYNFGVVKTTVGPNSTPEQRFNAVVQAVQGLGVTIDPNASNAFTSTGGVMPQGQVLFGLFRSLMRELSDSAVARWSIQKGAVVVIPNSGYLPGEAVVLNSQSGLIGVPEVTDSGINARMLLNAKLRIGGLVNINQKLINQQVVQQQGYPSYNSLYFPAQVSSDGNYRVLVMSHEGDTRLLPWWTDITCLNVSLSALAGSQVQPYPNG